MSIIEDYSPMSVGDTGIPLGAIFQHKDSTPYILTGATFALKMMLEDGTTKTCSGAWTIDDALNGYAHYQWQAGDVNTAGLWTLYITITIGGLPVHAAPRILEIVSAP